MATPTRRMVASARPLAARSAPLLTITHVVPRRQHVYGQVQFGGTFQRLLSSLPRAPGNVLKQTMMLRLHPEQVVTAVKGGPEHRQVPWPGKHVGSLDQKRCWQRGTVGIDDHRGGMAAFEELRNRVIDAVPQRRAASLDQSDFARRTLPKEGPPITP